jgi:hypothetical protein
MVTKLIVGKVLAVSDDVPIGEAEMKEHLLRARPGRHPRRRRHIGEEPGRVARRRRIERRGARLRGEVTAEEAEGRDSDEPRGRWPQPH